MTASNTTNCKTEKNNAPIQAFRDRVGFVFWAAIISLTLVSFVLGGILFLQKGKLTLDSFATEKVGLETLISYIKPFARVSASEEAAIKRVRKMAVLRLAVHNMSKELLADIEKEKTERQPIATTWFETLYKEPESEALAEVISPMMSGDDRPASFARAFERGEVAIK